MDWPTLSGEEVTIARLCLKWDGPSPPELSVGGEGDTVEWPTLSVKDRATQLGWFLSVFAGASRTALLPDGVT